VAVGGTQMPSRVSTGDRDAVKFLGAELIKVSKTRHLTVKIVSPDFAAASKNSGKNPCCLLKIDFTSVIDANENEHASRRYTAVLFCFGDEIMMICHY